ncbi:hypothetical protein LTR10_011150 [Elasticomyces elasticus]|nr:hypothetical protein LTR10_011150 [Elasticomyces elasticus]
MKAFQLLVAVTSLTPTFAFPHLTKRQATPGSQTGWQAPGPNDARGPCPGMNTLANHNYLPHDGRGITLQILKDGMKEGYNINSGDARLLFSQAVRTNPRYPLARSFDLDTLGVEGVLEHDISLSRTDRYFGDPLPFNATVWAETSTHFPNDYITVPQLAEARMARLETSKSTNPEHELSALGSGFSWGECASFFEIMADGTEGKVKKEYIDYWLENERLPVELGWQKRSTEMQGSEREEYSQQLKDLGEGGESSASGGSLSALLGGGRLAKRGERSGKRSVVYWH